MRRSMAVGELARAPADPRPEPPRRSSLSRPPARTQAAGRPLRPPHRRRPRTARPAPPGSSAATPRSPPARSATGAGRPAGDRETGARPRRPRPGRRHRWCRTGTPRLVAVRDKTCVFPWCTRPARRCDTDHIVPHNRGGPTCPCNLAPLCRRHHRIKTHGGWTYRRSSPAPTCGPRSTATSTSATRPAPNDVSPRPAHGHPTRLTAAPHPASGGAGPGSRTATSSRPRRPPPQPPVGAPRPSTSGADRPRESHDRLTVPA